MTSKNIRKRLPSPQAGDTVYRVFQCPTCRRRRHIIPTHQTTDRWMNDYQHWICSRGHTWRVQLGNLHTLNRLLKREFLPLIVQELNTPSPLFKMVNR